MVPSPGVWSAGKDAEHAAEAVGYHEWIARYSLAQKVPPRPRLERAQLTASRTQREVVALLRTRTNNAVSLVSTLTDEQLALPPRPPRANLPTLAHMIERVMIRHISTHQAEIESKLRQSAGA